ncbi:serine/threonine-protein kinase OXI1 [Dendrobium catenatum]|uniref:non-specific serine/threonine protein kinase n=1 Tax=Dendrobium catenatum TaxID=906689 RepID=A0A2I0W5Y4_9ASPA|nr:serine/threonine-protein kinase OXI1 [Dendrobium catenatum]PKU71074.1 Serine/threonine-protein kinase OXI1 [Dendrobium catenatum]
MAERLNPPTLPATIELSDLTAASILGRGGNGIVFLVRHLTSGETLALKSISKPSSDADFRRIWFERDVLLELQHPLLPSLRGIVSTDKIVGFAIDYCPGGDLNTVRSCQTEKMFSLETIHFYAVEMVIALTHLHNLGIIYRDLKPENVMIQENGHIMLIDFDLSTKLPTSRSSPKTPFTRSETLLAESKRKKLRSLFRCCSRHAGVTPDLPTGDPLLPSPAKSKSFVGTEEYVAPEIIIGKGHDFAVDWWGLGVILYEMLYARTPFRGQNRRETFRRILHESPDLVGKPMPLRDLIRRMLVKDPSKRITSEEIKRHEFFRGVDWDLVVDIARPPYIPMRKDWDEGIEGLEVEKIVEKVFEKALAAKETSVTEVRNLLH